MNDDRYVAFTAVDVTQVLNAALLDLDDEDLTALPQLVVDVGRDSRIRAVERLVYDRQQHVIIVQLHDDRRVLRSLVDYDDDDVRSVLPLSRRDRLDAFRYAYGPYIERDVRRSRDDR